MSEERVEILEVGPRDGLQNEPEIWSVAEKLELISRAQAAGFRRIEAGSFVNPAKVPQMAGSDEIFMRLAGRDGEFIALALNVKGVHRALAAGAREINYSLAASDGFSVRNAGADVEGALQAWPEAVAAARAGGAAITATLSTAFGCPFDGEVPAGRVAEIVARIAQAEPDEIALADTIGVADPRAVRARFADAASVCGARIRLRAHFHDTRNTGVANAVAAYEAGVRTLDGSIAGIGGCPFAPGAAGNVASEDLIYMFERMGVRTGIDLGLAIEAARFVAGRIGRAAATRVGRAGGFPHKA